MSEFDEQLLQRVKLGDREALRDLLRRYGPSVRERIDREIEPIWRSSLDADDVMQVTYLEAFLDQDRLVAESGPAFAAWLDRIAMNNLRDARRELGRGKRPHPARRVTGDGDRDASCVALVEMLSDGGDTPSRGVARAEVGQVVRALVERLPADYAEVIRLYDLDGQSIGDVAARMSRGTGAVHMLRLRAHDRLRLMIGRETDFFSNPT